MLDKRPRSPDLGEINAGASAGTLVKRQKSDGLQIIGTVTKEVSIIFEQEQCARVMMLDASDPPCRGRFWRVNEVPPPLALVAPPMQGFKRTSNLHAPIMQLSGHAGEVFTLRFSPDGEVLASGSYDRTILLWRTFSETCENYMMLR